VKNIPTIRAGFWYFSLCYVLYIPIKNTSIISSLYADWISVLHGKDVEPRKGFIKSSLWLPRFCISNDTYNETVKAGEVRMRQPGANINKGSKRDVTLYDRYTSTVFTYLYQQLSSRQEAEDLLLEVFVAALNNDSLSAYTDEQQVAWLRRVARNKVIDWYRHNRLLTLLPVDHALTLEDDDLTPEQRTVQQESYEYLHLIIAKLAPLPQQIIRLRYGNGLRLVEIAAMLTMPEGTVRKLLSRTLQNLRTLYDQQDQPEKGTHR
jgi:RNA polymerase sigma factor (sigma-70 family)